MSAPAIISELIERFERGSAQYRSSGYNGILKLAPSADVQANDLHKPQIAATDSEIDRLVYQRYGLTEEEIGIMEGNG
jgi:hypothetical protein